MLNVLGFLDFPGAVLSGASLSGGLLENPCKNKRQRRPGEGCPKGGFWLFRALCINAKPYKEQGWEKKTRRETILEWL